MPLSILRLLSADAFRSGQDISRQLAVSRASVHNAVALARALGAEIHAVRGRGYRLACRYTWLDATQLGRQLGEIGYTLELREAVDSTNSRLMLAAQQGEVHKRVLAAETQSAGRGRRGRDWLAQLGGSLTFSVLWRFQRPLTALSGLSLVVGLTLCRVLRAQGVSGAGVKWPNDVLVGDRKLAGILIETHGDMLSAATAVIGIGINVRVDAALAERAGQAVADLAGEMGRMPDRNDLLVAVLGALDEALERFDAQGFAPFREEWRALHAWQGRSVRVLGAAGATLTGEAVDVDEQGALLLATPEGMRAIHSGEVSLRTT